MSGVDAKEHAKNEHEVDKLSNDEADLASLACLFSAEPGAADDESHEVLYVIKDEQERRDDQGCNEDV